MEKIVRALDVGYGNVKFIRKHSSLDLVPVVDKFPSRAVISNDTDISGGMLSRRKTVHVEVEGRKYEVGYDVTLAQGTHDETTSLEKNFCTTQPYLARALGAFYYMYDDLDERKEIDLLVCGLPVSSYTTYRADVQRILTNEFRLPSGRHIKINKVTVIPQPLGAYFYYLAKANEEFKKGNNLVIDPGFFTFDWLVSKGMLPNTNRSGSVSRGMSAVLKAMAESIAKKEKTDVSTVFKILDDAIRDGVSPRLFGREIDMDAHRDRAKAVINEAITQLISNVGDGADIDNIMVAGGGTDYYIDAIREKFPRHNILTCRDPVYANVVGFQHAGIIAASKLDQAKNNKSSLSLI